VSIFTNFSSKAHLVGRTDGSSQASAASDNQPGHSPDRRRVPASVRPQSRAATAAESLRQRFGGRLVFCVGTESSLFTRGDSPGPFGRPARGEHKGGGPAIQPLCRPLRAFLAEASQRVRQVFHGPHMELGEVDTLSVALHRIPVS
jgi:hypothetical protein